MKGEGEMRSFDEIAKNNLSDRDIKESMIWARERKSNLDLLHLIEQVISRCLDGKVVSILVNGQEQAEFCIEQIQKRAIIKLDFRIEGTGDLVTKVVCEQSTNDFSGTPNWKKVLDNANKLVRAGKSNVKETG